MPQEFTIRSSPTYRALDTVLPAAEALRSQQEELTARRGQALQAIGEELRAAMAQGYDSAILTMTGGWRERALEQAGYEVSPCPPHMGADRHFIYWGERDAADKATLLGTLDRPDGASTRERYAPAAPPSPSIYARSMYDIPSPPPRSPPLVAPPLAPAVRPPFDRGHTMPGPEYRTMPARPERTVAFEADVARKVYAPAPGRRF